MRFILNILLVGLVVVLLSYLLPGAHVDSFVTAIIVALVLALLNALLRPLLILLTIPITVLTLGLFLLVINAIIVLAADALIPGFNVDGFLWAMIFSILLSFVTWLVGSIAT